MPARTVKDRVVTEQAADLYAAAAGPLPIYSIEQIANYLTKGYWADQLPAARAHGWEKLTITYDISALSTGRQLFAEMAFASWAEFSGLEFVEATGGSADIDFVMEPEAPVGESKAWETDNAYQGRTISSATIHLATNFSDETSINSTAYETFIHEIGHALGLGHGGDYNGPGGGRHYQNDTRQFSIMSYGAQGSFGGASGVDVLTPQMADIYAIIRKYGSADVRAGDTTYGFNASGQNAQTAYLYDFNNFQEDSVSHATGWAPTLTIVDTGGIDTLDLSGYYWDQTIDLRGGHWSSAGQFIKNIGIYRTTVIENAVGGDGDDRIGGNRAANTLSGGEGEDTIAGLQGNDLLSGGTEADIFKFSRAGDIDHITDFEDTIDQIDLTSMDFVSFAKVLKLAKEVGADLVLNFGNDDRLIIDDFSKGEFDSADVLI